MKKRLVLTFPANRVNDAVTYKLIKDFDILVNILCMNIPSITIKNIVKYRGEKLFTRNWNNELRKKLGLSKVDLKNAGWFIISLLTKIKIISIE